MDKAASLSKPEKVAEAIRLSLPHIPVESRQVVAALLEPRTLAIVSASIVAWIGSHLLGVGEFVDVILLAVGVATLGFSVFEGAREMLSFAEAALTARVRQDLEAAGRHFAQAVTILGISTVQALRLRGGARAVRARGVPRYRPMEPVGVPPPNGNQLRVSRPTALNSLGVTDEYGAIQVSRDQSLSEQRATLPHELVHRFFSPRVGPLRRFRASLNMTGYSRSALLRYIEEMLAEGYAQFRINGLAAAVRQWRFPLSNGYVTVGQVAVEGRAIGTIVLGGVQLHVSVSNGVMPALR